MVRLLLVGSFLTILSGCGGNSDAKLISLQPQIYNADENSVIVTRQGFNVTSTDTERLADKHCGKYNKEANLTKLANPFKLPFADEFACE